jgi:hypothetical protein
MDTRQQLDAGALAGAVFTQYEDFASAEIEGHILDRRRAAEDFGSFEQADDRPPLEQLRHRGPALGGWHGCQQLLHLVALGRFVIDRIESKYRR